MWSLISIWKSGSNKPVGGKKRPTGPGKKLRSGRLKLEHEAQEAHKSRVLHQILSFASPLCRGILVIQMSANQSDEHIQKHHIRQTWSP